VEVYDKYCDENEIGEVERVENRHALENTTKYALFCLGVEVDSLKEAIKKEMPKWLKWLVN